MTNFNDINRAIQKQNQTMQGILGSASLQGLASAIEKQNKAYFNFSSLSGITDIAKSISHQMKRINTSSMITGANIQAHLDAIKYPKSHSVLFGLTSTLAEIAMKNQLVSNSLSGFATSQLSLSNNLSAIAKTLNQSHLNSFNSLDIALQSISKNYLSNIALTKGWDDISIAEQANETITNIAENLLDNKEQITAQDLDFFKDSIVSELFGLLGETKSHKGRKLIFEIIAIISFLLIFYNPFVVPTDKSNKEITEEIKLDVENLDKDLSKEMEFELKRLNKTRTAETNVNLRYADKKNSKIIGLVKSGQQVTVIEIRHKYILISYIDMETLEPKSGFVVKKYFSIDK